MGAGCYDADFNEVECPPCGHLEFRGWVKGEYYWACVVADEKPDWFEDSDLQRWYPNYCTVLVPFRRYGTTNQGGEWWSVGVGLKSEICQQAVIGCDPPAKEVVDWYNPGPNRDGPGWCETCEGGRYWVGCP